MRLNSCIFSALAFLAVVRPVQAQDISGPFLGAPGIIDFKSSALVIKNNASRSDAQTVLLTQYAQKQSGSVELPFPVCAQEYVWSYELNAGTNTAFLSGAGFRIYKTQENTHKLFGTWNESFPELKTSSGESNRFWELHFDTFQDWWEDNGKTIYERDGNSVYFWNYGLDSLGNVAKTERLNQPMPFAMENGGWFQVKMHFKLGELRLKVSRNDTLVFEKVISTGYVPNKPHNLIISAWTGASSNYHSVRNVRFEGITADKCTNQLLSLQEATAELTKACGTYSSAGSCPQVCISATLTGLMLEGRLNLETYDSLGKSCQANVCEGEKASSYKSGLSAAATNSKPKIQEPSPKGLPTDKVTICHMEPKKKPVIITISRSALETHLKNHGDVLGECPKLALQVVTTTTKK